MKYKNVEIGIPTLEMIEEYRIRRNLASPAIFIFNFYKDRNWTTKSGYPLTSVEAMCNAANSVFVRDGRKNGTIPPKETNKAVFCEQPITFQPIRNFIAYTDGSCDNLSAKRAGGAAYIIFNEDMTLFRKASKGFEHTTNNRMELLAILSVVNAVPEYSGVTIHTDSEYCITALNSRNPKKNLDLIAKYHRLSKNIAVKFEWVKGHSGNIYNEECDRMANAEFQKIK